MNTPSELKYTKDHEWVKLEGNVATIGITDFAQSELGDIVFVDVDTVDDDLNVRADFSLRDNQTRITNILLDDSQITGGQRLMSVKVSADYNISQNFNLRFFYDQLMTKYKISTAFPLSTVRAGITATFNFGGGQGF